MNGGNRLHARIEFYASYLLSKQGALGYLYQELLCCLERIIPSYTDIGCFGNSRLLFFATCLVWSYYLLFAGTTQLTNWPCNKGWLRVHWVCNREPRFESATLRPTRISLLLTKQLRWCFIWQYHVLFLAPRSRSGGCKTKVQIRFLLLPWKILQRSQKAISAAIWYTDVAWR